jgi:glutamine synthetase
MCEIANTDGTPHESNTRAKLLQLLQSMGEDLQEWAPMFGIEQEYVLMESDGVSPFGWTEQMKAMSLHGGIKTAEDGKFYCGVGADRVVGRSIVVEHMNKCIEAGVMICGINAEVAPAQWEFQIGVCNAVEIGDNLWMARYILSRVAESHNACISYHPKPFGPNWNGSGGHTNFSTAGMRASEGMKHINTAIDKLSKNHGEHMAVYGEGNNLRLTGIHETSDMGTFTFGDCNRGSSIRIPANVKNAGCGYFEDRRPAANLDPYLVSWRMVKTVCCE